MIYLKSIHKKIGNTTVFSDLTLRFPDVGLYFLTGDNGCGKTTLLYILAMLDRDYTGDYLLDGEKVNGLTSERLDELRRKNISLLLPKGNLIDFLTVRENVYLDCKAPKNFLEPEDRSVLGLSGGEEILYALSNELGKNKKILLLDEVTSSLSDKNADKVMQILTDYSSSHLVIMASHDERAMHKGSIIRLGNEADSEYSYFNYRQSVID